MTESRQQRKLIAALKDGGAMVLNVHGHAMQARGWPDIWVGSLLWQGWLELKWRARPVQALQKDRIVELMERDVWAFVLRFGQDGDALLQRLAHCGAVQCLWAFDEMEWRDGRRFLERMAAICRGL